MFRSQSGRTCSLVVGDPPQNKQVRPVALEAMSKDEPKQKTRPKKGEPVEIPVPKKRDVMRSLRKVARPK